VNAAAASQEYPHPGPRRPRPSAAATAAQHSGRAHERIHGRVQREKAFEHRGEKIEPGVLPRALIELEHDVEPSTEGSHAGTGDAGSARRGGDADEGIDRDTAFLRVSQVIKSQHFAQSGCSLSASDYREVAERKMGDEMPEPALAQRPPQRRGGRGQTGKPCDGGGTFDEADFRTTAAEWKSRRQVSVEAEIQQRHGSPCECEQRACQPLA